MQWIDSWYLTRATGITSYVLLSISVIVGLSMRIRKQRGLQSGAWAFLHQPLGNWALYMALIHTNILFFSHYVHLNWIDLYVPFASKYYTVSMGLGIIALYALIITIILTEFRQKIGLRIWSKFHALTPVLYILATIHGLAMGTDSSSQTGVYMYMASTGIVLLLLLIRMFMKKSTAQEVIS